MYIQQSHHHFSTPRNALYRPLVFCFGDYLGLSGISWERGLSRTPKTGHMKALRSDVKFLVKFDLLGVARVPHGTFCSAH